MDEEAGFEARAVLAPARRRWNQGLIVLPMVAVVAIAIAGLAGPHRTSTAELPVATAIATASPGASAVSVAIGPSAPPAHPPVALGLPVHPLDQLVPAHLGEDEVVAVAGWYIPTGVGNCPPLAAIYRDGALPYLRGDADTLAFCERSGVLYAAPPDVDGRLSTSSHETDGSRVGPPAVTAQLAVGIIVPLRLEAADSGATEVVVIGRFVETGSRCGLPPGCHRGLVVDHVAWTPGA
jgi:hypothetical protein